MVMNCVHGRDWGRPPRDVLTSNWSFLVFVICHINCCADALGGGRGLEIWWWPPALNKYGGLALRSHFSDWVVVHESVDPRLHSLLWDPAMRAPIFLRVVGGSVCVLHGLGEGPSLFTSDTTNFVEGKKGPMDWPGATCIVGNPQVGWNVPSHKRCSILESGEMSFSWAGCVWLKKPFLSQCFYVGAGGASVW